MITIVITIITGTESTNKWPEINDCVVHPFKFYRLANRQQRRGNVEDAGGVGGFNDW